MLRGPVLTRVKGWVDSLHDDFVEEWPQSGERIIGRDNAIAIE